MLKILTTLAAGIALLASASAQPDLSAGYPNRAVKIVVSAPPGGGVDIGYSDGPSVCTVAR